MSALLFCTPFIGPLATLILHGSIEREAAKMAVNPSKALALRALKISRRDIEFYSVINTISHLFLASVCSLPRIAKSLPSITSWVFGVGALISLIHAIVAYRFGFSTIREIAPQKTKDTEKCLELERAAKDRASMMMLESLCHWIKENLSSNAESVANKANDLHRKALEEARQLENSPKHGRDFKPIIAAIQASIDQGKNVLPEDYNQVLGYALWYDSAVQMTQGEVALYKSSLNSLIEQALSNKKVPDVHEEFGSYHEFRLRGIQAHFLLKYSPREDWKMLKALVSDLITTRVPPCSAEEKLGVKNQLKEVLAYQFTTSP